MDVLIVGAHGDDDGGRDRGALYVLFMLATGKVNKEQKIGRSEGGGGVHLDMDNEEDLLGSVVGVVREAYKGQGVFRSVVTSLLPLTAEREYPRRNMINKLFGRQGWWGRITTKARSCHGAGKSTF